MKLRATARSAAHEILCRLGLADRFADRTHQHGVLDIAVSHVSMARVIVSSDNAATVLLYTHDGDYRLRVWSESPFYYELETP